MHRIAWLVFLAACRIGFEEHAPDAGDGLEMVAPSGQPFTSDCQPGGACLVDCSHASSCTVQCNNAAFCDVTCPPDGCAVTGCYPYLCEVECTDGAGTHYSPTRYTSFATCP